MSDLSARRETGSQKASGACSNCGGPVPLVQTEYGSTSVGACPVCWPQEKVPSQLAAQQKAARGPRVKVALRKSDVVPDDVPE